MFVKCRPRALGTQGTSLSMYKTESWQISDQEIWNMKKPRFTNNSLVKQATHSVFACMCADAHLQCASMHNIWVRYGLSSCVNSSAGTSYSLGALIVCMWMDSEIWTVVLSSCRHVFSLVMRITQPKLPCLLWERFALCHQTSLFDRRCKRTQQPPPIGV